jgi:hypothetical protein
MKIYLAADYARKNEMQGCRDIIEGLGHKVTSTWIDTPNEVESAGIGGKSINLDNMQECGAYGLTDYSEILQCDTLIQFTTGEKSRGGRHVEYGIAIGAGKNIIIIGPREHVFHCGSSIRHYPSWRSFVIDFSKGWND